MSIKVFFIFRKKRKLKKESSDHEEFRLHLKLPFFNLVGWDVAIQEAGNPVLIEFNTNPGLSQSAFGSGMGVYTERIRELWPRPNIWFKE